VNLCTLVGASTGAVELDLLADGNPVIYWQYAVVPQMGEVKVGGVRLTAAGLRQGTFAA
jgi:hypothetical protein